MVLGFKKINQKRQAKKYIRKKLQLPTSFLLKGGKNQIGYFKNLPSTGYVLPDNSSNYRWFIPISNNKLYFFSPQHFLPFPDSLWKMYIVLFILGLSLTKNLHVLTRSSKILILGKSHWIASP